MKEIEHILRTYDRTDFSKTKAALATVVRVEQSSYRRIGARMFVTEDGNWTGGISGGCLEGDALKRAKMAIIKNTPSVVIYDTTRDDDRQIGVGLGCQGRIDVLFSPVDPDYKNNPIEVLRDLPQNRTPSVLIQIIDSENKTVLGKLSTEEHLAAFAENLNLKKNTLEKIVATTKQYQKSCIQKVTDQKGNTHEILIEFLRPKIKLVLVGDNYDVNTMISVGKELGWEIHVAGKRIFFNRFAFEQAQKLYTLDNTADIEIDKYTAVVLMSHDYQTDLNLLPSFLEKNAPYIGVLGPKKRMEKLQNDLPHFSFNSLQNLFGPVGLDIGAETPEEIALSVTSEIIAVFRNRKGGALRDRIGAIHE